MKRKLVLSLTLIALTLVISCAIAFYEFAKVAGDMVSIAESPERAQSIVEMYQRALLPAVVSLGISLVLIILLGFFILTYYINPIHRMHRGLESFISFNRKYTVKFEGNDVLKELNRNIEQMTLDNDQLRHRLYDKARNTK